MIPGVGRLWILVLLAWAAWLGVERPWQGDAFARTAARVGQLFPELQGRIDEVARVVIEDTGGTATLELTDESSPYGPGRWLVREKQHPADTARLARLVDGMSRLETIDVVSVEEANHGTYGVAEGQGTRVRLYDAADRLMVDWIAGKIRDQDVRQGQKVVFEYYMRDGRRPEVFLSADPVQPATGAVDWCDVGFLAALDPDRVSSIERQDFRGDQSWRLVRVEETRLDDEEADSAWRLDRAEGEVALAFAADSLLFTLTGLRAADVVTQRGGRLTEEDARYGFPQDRFQVVVGEETLTLDLGQPAEDGQRYLRVSGLPHIYTLTDFDVGQLRQTRARMIRRDG